jgi:signal transduction histidine kinase
VRAGSFKLAPAQPAQQAVARQEQLHALGELAAGVAHDVSNTLAAIALRLSALKRDEVCMEAQGENIEAISRILQEGSEMVRKLQRLGQRDEHRPPEWVDVAATIRSAVEMAQSGLRYRALNDGIDIRIDVVLPQLPFIRGWSDEVRRVFVNLLLNARDALPGGGRIVVKARADARRVVVTVADDGVGIQQAALPRLFEPFFTTKGIAGSGMGLATALRVMRMMGGEITAANGATGGAVFRLTFPIPPAIKTATTATTATQQSANHDAIQLPPD